MKVADLALRLLRGAERAGPAGPVAPGQKRAADAKAGILRQQAEDLVAVPQGARMADGGLYPHQGQWLSLLRRKAGVAGGKRSGVPAAGPAGAMAPHQNLPMTPERVTVGSHFKAWWVCEQGHEWQAIVKSRTLGGCGCPVCAGRVLMRGINDLATTHPELAKQWHPTKMVT